ncbi:DNA/RNA non-specific endonuclease [uncultured Tenacibaculum sp.]|uniref:DNA/RNA non-specific endonuclease n=1 Tax=uncultured Tenacibaculum sp. TaxID=174713 RepID=UPI0026042A1B|nr:DNA/RNA non-specific endonuclease [uncultured Tenacibaculum sp.]
MKLISPFKGLIYLLSLSLLLSCNDDEIITQEKENTIFEPLKISGSMMVDTNFYDNQGPHEHNYTSRRITGFTEGFESKSKFFYNTTTIDLNQSGNWSFSDAKIGTGSRDRKFGSRAARLRETGYILMAFNMEDGVKTIRIRHAKYGNDDNSSWQLVASYDNGDSWISVGETINTTSTTLNTVSFEVNENRNVRYGVSKVSGGSNRINIDNFEIVTDANGGGDNGGDNAGRDSNLTFGNPSDANTTSPNNYFLVKPEFTLSYNNENGTPNWVSWHLNADWLGSRGRCNCFQQDNSLPSNFKRIGDNEYRSSGFHRGHICPSADRTVTGQENANTFFMTNMAPQAPRNNTRPWVGLERHLRSLVNSGNEIHIIAGVIGTGGSGSRGYREKLSNGRINVPGSFWKVALILPNGTNDINRVTTNTKIIAVNIPNNQNVSSNWRQYLTSVDAIENLTGYDFFENIPDAIENIIESNISSRSSI